MKKRGLVLGGGGAKGSYEVGAIKALEACGYTFDCVSGTSIGALIGAIYAQKDVERLVDFVYDLSPGMIVKNFFELPEDFEDLMDNKEEILSFISNFIKTRSNDITPLIETFQRMFDYEKFICSDVEYACMTYNVSKMVGQPFYKKEFRQDLAISIIIASASCFPAFPMMEIEGEKFIDGGYAENVPISLVKEMQVDSLVVIDIRGPGRYVDYPKDPSMFLIEPLLPLGNFLDFRKEQGIRSLFLGYLETMKYLERYCGYLYTFDLDSLSRLDAWEEYAKTQFDHLHIHFEDDFVFKASSSILGYEVKVVDTTYVRTHRYTILLEALALCCGVDIVVLYSFDEFIHAVQKHLHSLDSFELPDTLKDIVSFIKETKKEDLLVFFHDILIKNQENLPAYYEPLAAVLDVTYRLSVLWILLDHYLCRDETVNRLEL